MGEESDSEDERRRAEARRILDRVSGEGDVLSSSAARAATRARDHFTARDAPPGDAMELWGRRIARALALVFVVILIVWLLGMLSGQG